MPSPNPSKLDDSKFRSSRFEPVNFKTKIDDDDDNTYARTGGFVGFCASVGYSSHATILHAPAADVPDGHHSTQSTTSTMEEAFSPVPPSPAAGRLAMRFITMACCFIAGTTGGMSTQQGMSACTFKPLCGSTEMRQ